MIFLSREELRKEWEARVAAFQASGQRLPRWCEENNVKPYQLRYWLQKTEATSESGPTHWLSVNVAPWTKEERSDASMVVRVGPATIEVHDGFDPVLFAQVAKALAELC
ncbi:IS66 family insertion sequence element accessory protein TnpA [Heliophilum fasciatum]|uniref:IS66 family insertion sequence element accessory protein TnpA n=1 Tax=Heliophilum fasciatum TaxID=35700 RepID=UPI003872E385